MEKQITEVTSSRASLHGVFITYQVASAQIELGDRWIQVADIGRQAKAVAYFLDKLPFERGTGDQAYHPQRQFTCGNANNELQSGVIASLSLVSHA